MNIRVKREELGMSPKELAEKAGITQSFLCDIEKGRVKPSIDVAAKIADVLKMPNEAKAMRKGNSVRAKLFGTE